MLISFSSLWTNFFPPKPVFTEKNVGNLEGKVYIVSGSNTGMGKVLANILYAKNAKVYIAARSEERAAKAMDEIKKAAPDSKGSLVFMKLDLGDLRTIKASADFFLARESKLHVLFNNAGVMYVDPKGPQTTPQGYEMNLGVNVLGTFLFTKLLTPALISTARSEPAGSVRVIWVSSLGTEMVGEKSIGLSYTDLEAHAKRTPMDRYALSKTGNWLHAVECARRLHGDGVVSVPINPGNLNTELARQHPAFIQRILRLLVYPSRYGAYTQLYAAMSSDISLANSGIWVAPFGRLYPIRKDLLDATKSKEEGGNGHAAEFWEWTEEQIKPYV
ncbi:uncharacterized protein Z519_04905 [Cladophialophora bantiana CBS 173.52]|uniref:Short-chain dehydrogenase n=1 Tax=Cladophialophora bantiana (strain ATCC 10958 / CBS 173.52 / CDC B-1940 / NIH 8579) TaxID=1442370 RepID=A0A0D2EY85_CLAB1|nr:uncharacterized protein Z519_04905 [Cladophialophora bantiana CBS 173.52]KIW94926.1 hypothetical protein Z519_04905 [Cladophialophora bantiana CBS 173.52]